MKLEFMLKDDTRVGYARCAAVPRVGEYIWMQRAGGSQPLVGKPQHEAFRVEEVAYWMGDLEGGLTTDSDTVAVYVSRVSR